MEITPHTSQTTDQYFIDCCRTKLMKEYLPKIESCMLQLSEDDIWWRAYETNNSVGNLILHLSGNIRQWVYHHLGGMEFLRDRNAEFSERTHIPTAELLAHVQTAVRDADAVLASFPTENLFRVYQIQKYSVTGMEAILHITEHFSYHVGQIVYITKLRSGNDLKFYHL
jgi:uncharacterized damage-inducible protein DinB